MTDGGPVANRAHTSRWLPGFVFTAFAAGLIAIAIFVLSLDHPLARRDDPQTENAYVGGDVTRVGARVSGYIQSLPVSDNRPIRAGDLVAVIEDDEYVATRDQARANLETAKAQLAAVSSQQLQLVAQIGQSQSNLTGTGAAIERSSPELTRQRMLVNTDAGMRRALDQAVADQQKAMATQSGAHAEFVVRKQQTAILDAQKREAEATVGARARDLDLAEINLAWTRILAPLDGTMAARQVRVGDLVNAGTEIVSVTPLDGVWVDANFTERQIVHVRTGQRATLRVDAFPGQLLEGRVAGMSPATGGKLSAVTPDNTTGNFTKVPARLTVRIQVVWGTSPLLGQLRPGMSVTATVQTGTEPAGGTE